RGAHRLPARRHRRGTRPGRRPGRDRPAVLAGPPWLRDRATVDRPRPTLLGPRRQGHRRVDRDPVADQRRRQHRRAADQGADPAADELWRLEHPRGVPRRGDPAADRLREPADDAGRHRMSRTLMIMAGGTGGHVMPGLAVADEMRSRSWHVVWLGVPGGLEAELVPSHGIPMRWVRIGGLRGKGLATRLLAPWRLARALWQALQVLREIRPAVVLGLGGYVAFPGGLVAALTGRPLVIHEQNSVAGLTNRVLARFARRVLVAFPEALPGAQWCGNPVRTAVAGLPPPDERMRGREGPLRLLVVGGSLGAKALNDAVPAALALMPSQRRPMVVHQSGKAHLD